MRLLQNELDRPDQSASVKNVHRFVDRDLKEGIFPLIEAGPDGSVDNRSEERSDQDDEEGNEIRTHGGLPLVLNDCGEL